MQQIGQFQRAYSSFIRGIESIKPPLAVPVEEEGKEVPPPPPVDTTEPTKRDGAFDEDDFCRAKPDEVEASASCHDDWEDTKSSAWPFSWGS